MLDGLPLFQVSMKATVSLVALTFGAIVLMGGSRRAPNLFLASFLGLIAINQGVEALRAGARGVFDDLILQRIALVSAAADPFFLYYFASIFPERNALNRRRYVTAVGAGCLTFLVLAPWFQGYASDGFSRLLYLFWESFTFLVYAAVFGRFLLLVRDGDDRPAPRLFYYAMAVAFIPIGPRVARQIVIAIDPALTVTRYAELTVFLPLTLIFAVIAAVVLRSRSSYRKQLLLGGLLGTVVSIAVMGEVVLGTYGFRNAIVTLWAAFPTSAAVRWLLFSTLASVAIVRYDVLGMRLASRRKAARLLVALGVVLVSYLAFVSAYTLFGGTGLELRPLDVIFLVMIIALSQGYRSLIDRVASVMYGVPPRNDQGAKITMYRAAVEQAERTGRTLAAERDLKRLQEELELDPKVAEVVDRMSTIRTAGRLAPGETVHGRYTIGHLLGRGASGRVFAAKDQLLERDVVLKEVIAPGASEEQAVLQEARLAGQVDHPNVVRVHDALPWEGGILLVTEKLDGGTLAEYIQRKGPLSPDEAARIFDGILAGLEAVHERGVIHRDLKPTNILLTRHGSPKIGDFGVATARAMATVAGDGKMWGTPEYMPPEQLRGERATERSDLFSVGVMIERCMGDRVPASWSTLLEKARAHDVDDRWSSAEEMRLVLRRVTRGLPEAHKAEEVTQRLLGTEDARPHDGRASLSSPE